MNTQQQPLPTERKPSLNPEQQSALDLMLRGQNLFLTGAAGSGKSTVIREFIRCCDRQVACLAPTGIAARNIGKQGMTIHRFFRINPGSGCGQNSYSAELRECLRNIDTILIDEISMVRSELFHFIDHTLKVCCKSQAPFGGKQMILVGDFCQLPPVVTDDSQLTYCTKEHGGIYAFQTKAWKKADLQNVYLQTVHRQENSPFLNVLNQIRFASADVANELARFVVDAHLPYDLLPALCASRARAADINDRCVAGIIESESCFHGCITGCYPPHSLPTERSLILKPGMDVMILANHLNDGGNEYVNGDIGVIVSCSERFRRAQVALPDRVVTVEPHRWTNLEYFYSLAERRLTSREIGSFTQLPLAPAYAMTIHKSQGQTLTNAHLELSFRRPCIPGQLYTALSRLRSWEHLTLNRAVTPADISMAPEVKAFYKECGFWTM